MKENVDKIEVNLMHYPGAIHPVLAFIKNNYNFWDIEKCREKYYGDEHIKAIEHFKRNQNRFIKQKVGAPSPGRFTSAIIDFPKYKSFENYQNNLSKNVKRDINIARKNNFYFKEFHFDNYVIDFCEINKLQKKKRNLNGKKPLNSFYDKTAEEHGISKIYKKIQKPEMPHHYTKWYGVFKYLKNYKQGDIVTNEKLVAYSGVAVDGELSCLTLIFGHPHYLKYGTMFFLTTNIVRELMGTHVKYLKYWEGPNLGGKLGEWKERILFEMKYLISKDF
jgi:hypothetical protein